MDASQARRLLAGAVSLFVLAMGCGPEEAKQVPSAPVGAIAGKVSSLKDGTALGGVKVSVIRVDDQGAAAELAVTTGADGSFALNGLPAGTDYRVRFALDGYVPRFRDVLIPAAAGDFPQGNGVGEANIALAPATGGIAGKILASGAKPAAGARLGIDLRPANFDLVAEATANGNGEYVFSGLPGAPTGVPVTLVVQPYDEDGDTRADYGVLQINSLSFPGVTTRTEIDLRQAAEALVLLGSDLDDGEQAANESIHLTFNRALNADSLEVTLTDLDANRDVGVSAAVSSGTEVVLTVSGGRLAEGAHYQLTVEARAANGAAGSFDRYFRAISSTGSTLPAVNGFTVSPDEVNWNTTTFNLSWDRVSGASAYRIYVRDTKTNPAYLLVKTVGSSPSPQTSLSLPSTFDTFSGDSQQTPFAFKTGVDFAVVAVNALGQAPSPGGNAVHKEDVVAGEILSVVQTDGADNTDGTEPKQLAVKMRFDEYVDTDNPPQIQLPAGLFSSFEPDPDLLGGRFSILVPPGLDASGAFQITNAYDTSGNLFPTYDGQLLAVSELLVNGDFDDCSLTGWTQYTTSSAPYPTIDNSTSASGTCSVHGGYLPGSGYYLYGESGVYQTVTLPSGASQITFSVSYRSFTDINNHDYPLCRLQNTSGYTLQTLFADSSNLNTWQTTSVDITGYAGQTVRVYCASYGDGSHVSGAWFDDISVVVTQ